MNWFDTTAPEGYFSLNDKMETILASKEGQMLFMNMLQQMGQKEKQRAGMHMTPGSIKNDWKFYCFASC